MDDDDDSEAALGAGKTGDLLLAKLAAPYLIKHTSFETNFEPDAYFHHLRKQQDQISIPNLFLTDTATSINFDETITNFLMNGLNDIETKHNSNFIEDQESTWSQLISTLFYKQATSIRDIIYVNDNNLPDQQQQNQHPNENLQFDINWPSLMLAIFLILLMLSTAIGNLFVIVAIVVEKNLRTIGNYLVLSLAIADLLVACLVMPLASIYQILDKWTLGVFFCDIWTSTDVFCCTASILHLLAIALDRYWAVTRVNYIRCQRNEKRILFMILFVWMSASVISLAPVFGWKDDQFERRIIEEHECLISQDIGYQIFATCTTFYFPLILTLIFYWKIFQVARKRIRGKPGNRIKISLQHPSSSSSNSSPNKHQQQHQQIKQQPQQAHSKFSGNEKQDQTYQALANYSPNENEYKSSLADIQATKFHIEHGKPIGKNSDDEPCSCKCHMFKLEYKSSVSQLEGKVVTSQQNHRAGSADVTSNHTTIHNYQTSEHKTNQTDGQSYRETDDIDASTSSSSETTIDMTGTGTETTNKCFVTSDNLDLDTESHCELCYELENDNDNETQSKAINLSGSRRTDSGSSTMKCDLCDCSRQPKPNQTQTQTQNQNQNQPCESYLKRRDTGCHDLNQTVESQLLDNKGDSCLVIAASTTNIAVSTSVRSPMANANSIHGFCTPAEVIESRRERKAAKTLAIITGVFVMCWLPFFIMAITMPLVDIKPHKYLFAVLLWLGYANSMLNPIIYTIFSPDFRKAFKRLIGLDDRSVKQRNQRRQELQQDRSNGLETGCFVWLPKSWKQSACIHPPKYFSCCRSCSSGEQTSPPSAINSKYRYRMPFSLIFKPKKDQLNDKTNERQDEDAKALVERNRRGDNCCLVNDSGAINGISLDEESEDLNKRKSQVTESSGRTSFGKITNDF